MTAACQEHLESLKQSQCVASVRPSVNSFVHPYVPSVCKKEDTLQKHGIAKCKLKIKQVNTVVAHIWVLHLNERQ